MILFEKRAGDICREDLEILSRELNMSPAFCKLLLSRGITDAEQALEFLNPLSFELHDPFLFRDMDKAVERIERALNEDERICIFGDYDVDGVCATSMLYMYLQYLGADVFYYIPSRHNEGYGMTPDGIKRVHERGARLIITVDNGIVATGETALAKSLGMDVIITDHHLAGANLPECTAVLCHSRADNTYPNTNLCGAGVALKLIAAHGGEEAASEFLPFAGFATVSDIVPLTGENRAIVAKALAQINSGDCPVGLKALMDISGIKDDKPISTHDFGYKLGPRLNAAGRLEDASLGVELLCSDFKEDADTIAKRLDELNDERRALESQIVESAREMLDKTDITNIRVIVLKSNDWNTGVLGIAASRISDEYYRPTVLFSEKDGLLIGSARSIPGVDIHALLSKFEDMYERFGGHKMAAGLTLSAERFDELNALLNEHAHAVVPMETYFPRKSYDTELSFSDINLKFIESVNLFAPFGEGNPTPVFITRDTKLSDLRIIGKGGEHLSGKALSDNRALPVISFYRSQDFEKLVSADTVDILYSPTINDWNGKTPQLQVRDFSVSGIDEGFVDRHMNDFYDAFLKNLILRHDKAEHAGNIRMTDEPECEMITLLTESFSGCMVLSFTPDGTRRALNILNEHNLRVDLSVGKPNSPNCAYNTVVAAPILNELSTAARHMKKVLVLDSAFDREALNALCAALPDAEITVSSEKVQGSIYTDFKNASERESMGILYREAIKKLKTAPSFLDDCAEYIAKKTGMNSAISEFALRVFTELEFIRMDKNTRLYADTEYKKRPLTDSALFARLINE